MAKQQAAAEPVESEAPLSSDAEISPLENILPGDEATDGTNFNAAPPSPTRQSSSTPEEPLVDENFEPIDR